MQPDRASVLRELEVQLELDDHRGCAPLAARVQAVARSQNAGERDAERQALVDLAAACIRRAETIPAPRFTDVRLRAARERAGIAA
ncbi:MAG: hypothetical protein ACLP0J_09440 [Solirubrobacteraceae bacterium]|jgi:hypothetical protein